MVLVQFAAETATTEPMPTLGDRIRARREERKLTQAQLAELLGVSFHTIVSWEKGARATPQAENLARIASFLGCSMQDLIEPSWTHTARVRAATVPAPDDRVPRIAEALPNGKRREFLDRLTRFRADAAAVATRLEQLRSETAAAEAALDALSKEQRAEIEVMEIVLEKLTHK